MARTASLSHINLKTLRTELGWDYPWDLTGIEIPTALVTNGYRSSINRITLFGFLSVLVKIHLRKELRFCDIKLAYCFQRYVQNCEIKTFVYEHNFLHIAKLLLRNCQSSMCKNITINMIIELTKDKDEYTVRTNVINCIGEDLDLVNFIINHFRDVSKIATESFITHSLLRLFHLVAFTISIYPESPWVAHLKNTNGFFGELIVYMLHNVSLPDNVLKNIFLMILKLLEVKFPNSSTTHSKPFLCDLFNMQQLIDNGIAQFTHVTFFMYNYEIPITDWSKVGMWLDMMLTIRIHPELLLAQSLNFDLTLVPVNVMAIKYLSELITADAEEELEKKFNNFLQVLRYPVIEKCILLVNTYKANTIKSLMTIHFLIEMNIFFQNCHSHINHLYATYYQRTLDLSTITDEDAKARVEELILHVRIIIGALKSLLDQLFINENQIGA